MFYSLSFTKFNVLVKNLGAYEALDSINGMNMWISTSMKESDGHGKVVTCKARLVANGSNQAYDIDYIDNFSLFI